MGAEPTGMGREKREIYFKKLVYLFYEGTNPSSAGQVAGKRSRELSPFKF